MRVMTTNFSLWGISANKYHHSVEWKHTNDNLAAEPIIDGMHAGKDRATTSPLVYTIQEEMCMYELTDTRLVHAMVSQYYQAA